MKFKFYLLAFLVIMPLTAFAQIPNTPFFYRPAQTFTTATLDGYTVQDAAHNRQIPIFIRYPQNATGQLPLILWSHGGNADANGKYGNQQWGTFLAQSGYIVIHQSHLGRSAAEFAALCSEFNVPNLQQCADSFGTLEVDRPRDANAVLADLDAIENNFPQIRGRIDRTKIAVAGHSFGSYTAMTLAGGRVELTPQFNDVSFANPLPRAFLTLSPQGPGRFGWKNNSWREIVRPVLLATGPSDNTPGEQAADRIVPFGLMPTGNKYLFYLNHPDSTHETFNLNNGAHPEFSQWLASYSLAFLDAKLKNRIEAQTYLFSSRINRASSKTATISRR